MTFRTVDISDPIPGAPGLRHVTVKSPSLGRRADISVYVPPGDGPLPLVVLLHGVYGSHWNWAVNGRAHLILAKLLERAEVQPMALAMPSDGLRGDGSGYVRGGGEDAEGFITHEVFRAAALVDERIGDRVFIAGLSMGGFGAVRLAFLHPERFVAAAGTSSVTSLAELMAFTEEGPGAFEAPAGTETLLEHIVRAPRKVPLHLDCGLDDSLLGSNRALHAGLLAAGIEHFYAEYPGAHTWDYWRARLPDILRFFDRVASD